MDAKFETFPVTRTFHITEKTKSKPQNTTLSTVTAATATVTPIPDKSSKPELSLYNGRKHETITAEVYIRNPEKLKPTIINVSTSDKAPKKPCWMVLKAYQSPHDTADKNIARKRFDKAMVRIQSDASLGKKTKIIEKLKSTNFSETTSNIASTDAIPKEKQEMSEQNQTKMPRSEMNFTLETQINTSIKSRIISGSKCFVEGKFTI